MKELEDKRDRKTFEFYKYHSLAPWTYDNMLQFWFGKPDPLMIKRNNNLTNDQVLLEMIKQGWEYTKNNTTNKLNVEPA